VSAVFPLVPRRRVLGLAFGGVRSARRGIGYDVAGTREYRPGDDVGWMDWASSAKLSAARGDDRFIVRERFADEAPRVVVLCDRRPSMSIRASALRRLDKPQAILGSLDLIGASAAAARSLTGYLDYAEGEPFWRPPRTEQRAEAGTLADRAFDAPAGSLSHGLRFLAEHRRDLPTQAFVFVLSDFIEPPDLAAWQDALGNRWELVPVVMQDAVWERSFPDVGGVSVPYADPRTGRVAPVRLSHTEAARLRDRHERRWEALVRDFRSLGIEPVTVDAHDRHTMLDAFLRWADLRLLWRGAIA
jgi:uncharacterized protein (DUF58 family)